MATIKSNCRKAVCIGRNYADHITELSSARPSQPFFFLKPSTSILLPDEGPIIRPKGVDLHHEIELGFIIGTNGSSKKSLKNISATDTNIMDYVKSYFLSIDVTARNIQWEAKKKGLPWSISKGFDTFLPVSQIIPKEKIPNPHDIVIWLSINGEIKQKDSTNLMLFDIPRMISDISKVFTLEEGDIIITGTPKGVGPMKAGDVVKCGIEIDGKELKEANIEVKIVDEEGEGIYEYKET